MNALFLFSLATLVPSFYVPIITISCKFDTFSAESSLKIIRINRYLLFLLYNFFFNEDEPCPSNIIGFFIDSNP